MTHPNSACGMSDCYRCYPKTAVFWEIYYLKFGDRRRANLSAGKDASTSDPAPSSKKVGARREGRM